MIVNVNTIDLIKTIREYLQFNFVCVCVGVFYIDEDDVVWYRFDAMMIFDDDKRNFFSTFQHLLLLDYYYFIIITTSLAGNSGAYFRS